MSFSLAQLQYLKCLKRLENLWNKIRNLMKKYFKNNTQSINTTDIKMSGFLPTKLIKYIAEFISDKIFNKISKNNKIKDDLHNIDISDFKKK